MLENLKRHERAHDDARDSEKLFRAADAAMYAVKRSTKNRVASAAKED